MSEREEGGSQIRDIANGVSTRTHQYHVRSQPAGQMPSTTEGNAARLTTVPSSSEEKYNGGMERGEEQRRA